MLIVTINVTLEQSDQVTARCHDVACDRTANPSPAFSNSPQGDLERRIPQVPTLYRVYQKSVLKQNFQLPRGCRQDATG
jgi:hypothetical protein